jgi:hypothetical protein
MLALDLYESQLCEGCGYHKSLAHDPEQMFDLVEEVCLLCADIAPRMRVNAKADAAEAKALEDKPKEKRWADGRKYLTRLLPRGSTR